MGLWAPAQAADIHIQQVGLDELQSTQLEQSYDAKKSQSLKGETEDLHQRQYSEYKRSCKAHTAFPESCECKCWATCK